MTLQTFLRLAAAPLALSLAGCDKQPVSAPPQVHDSWARETAEGAKMAAAYLTISNPGDEPIRLAAVETPVAAAASIHESRTENGVASMKALPDGLTIEPGITVTLKPGGHHIMLEGLDRRLLQGDTFALTLKFSGNTSLTVPVTVRDAAAR